MSFLISDWRMARSDTTDPGSDQIGAVLGMEGGMYHLADHERCAEPSGSAADTGTAFGGGQAFASALKRHVQQATVLEFAKHCRDLLAAHLSQVSPKIVNILVWQNNGDVAHA
jgi:hypothetical protein